MVYKFFDKKSFVANTSATWTQPDTLETQNKFAEGGVKKKLC